MSVSAPRTFRVLSSLGKPGCSDTWEPGDLVTEDELPEDHIDLHVSRKVIEPLDYEAASARAEADAAGDQVAKLKVDLEAATNEYAALLAKSQELDSSHRKLQNNHANLQGKLTKATQALAKAHVDLNKERDAHKATKAKGGK